MSAGDFLARLVALLEAAGIPYMVAGSFASTFHGVARATQDLDIVVDPSGPSLDAFLASLDADVYYADPDTARDAFRRRSQFNVIDMTTGWKADLTSSGGFARALSSLSGRVSVPAMQHELVMGAAPSRRGSTSAKSIT